MSEKSGLDLRRLVLIESRAGDGTYKIGTGYFVTRDLVLTASHVVADGTAEEIRVRPEQRSQGGPRWRPAKPRPVWHDVGLDAVLIEVEEPLPEVDLPEWGSMPETNVDWGSAGYPIAASTQGDRSQWKTTGLEGKLYALGGGGQGRRELDLSVEAEAKESRWQGISGAPVFVDDRLVGILKSVPTDFSGKRLNGLPTEYLLESPDFRSRIAPRWIQPLPEGTWSLVLVSERDEGDLGEIVEEALEKHGDTIGSKAGEPVNVKPLIIKVTDAIESPDRWLSAVRALCSAPVMIADLTGLEPAVMLLLGIRSVVRRGVTVMTTAEAVDSGLLSTLPFNILESKLIHHGHRYEYDHKDPKNPLGIIAEAIAGGLRQLSSHPGYLDLPVYDAVRCPEPDKPRKPAKRPALILCPFQKKYEDEYWRYFSSKIDIKLENEGMKLARMLDITSPRLVGQALYEHIRWSHCCVVDWTFWRPNVFFELGARLACSDIGPLCFIETGHAESAVHGNQESLLLKLFEPERYTLKGPKKPFDDAFERYEAIINKEAPPASISSLRHDATYQIIKDAYGWSQERIVLRPDEELKLSTEIMAGKDPQKRGSYPALFSANPEFKARIEESIRERWIAAWLSLRHRYSDDELQADDKLRDELRSTGETAWQWLTRSSASGHQRIRDEIKRFIDELDLCNEVPGATDE